jgi:hypothetical protein
MRFLYKKNLGRFLESLNQPVRFNCGIDNPIETAHESKTDNAGGTHCPYTLHPKLKTIRNTTMNTQQPLNQSLEIAKQRLSLFATDPEFLSKMQVAFGDKTNTIYISAEFPENATKLAPTIRVFLKEIGLAVSAVAGREDHRGVVSLLSRAIPLVR